MDVCMKPLLMTSKMGGIDWSFIFLQVKQVHGG